MREHSISALVLRRGHLARETLAFQEQGKRALQWQEEGSPRPEMAAQQSALTGPVFVCGRMCAGRFRGSDPITASGGENAPLVLFVCRVLKYLKLVSFMIILSFNVTSVLKM